MPRGVEQVQAAIEAHSLANIDDYVKTSTMHPELEEVSIHPQRNTTSLRR